MSNRIILLVLLLSLFSITAVNAAQCNNHNGFICDDEAFQFDDSFTQGLKYTDGGFGGGNCVAEKTPIIFLHGNGDNALSWLIPPHISTESYPLALASVYQTFKNAGYNDCELFGLTYLSSSQQTAPQYNYHKADKLTLVSNFIDDVSTYTGKSKVHIVSHSLGVSIALASLTKHQQWDKVDRFIGISGALRGLSSCLYMGYANALSPTCGAQNVYNNYVFGFYPDTGAMSPLWGQNQWTGSRTNLSMRNMPNHNLQTKFYSVSAGLHDQIHCTSQQGRSQCAQSPLFNAGINVVSQLNIGSGGFAAELDFDFSDLSPYNLSGGDLDGIGHFNSKINSGVLLLQMISTDCQGVLCAATYQSGPVVDALSH